MGTSHEDQYTFFISRSLLLRMKNISDKSCRENQNTHCIFSNFFFFWKWYHLWDNEEKYCRARPQKTICCMCIACWITKDTDTHLKYVILIALTLLHLLHELELSYTYDFWLVIQYPFVIFISSSRSRLIVEWLLFVGILKEHNHDVETLELLHCTKLKWIKSSVCHVWNIHCAVYCVLQCKPSPLQQYLNYSSIFMKSAVDYHIHVFQVHPITASTVNFTWRRYDILNIVWLVMFEYWY